MNSLRVEILKIFSIADLIDDLVQTVAKTNYGLILEVIFLLQFPQSLNLQHKKAIRKMAQENNGKEYLYVLQWKPQNPKSLEATDQGQNVSLWGLFIYTKNFCLSVVL